MFFNSHGTKIVKPTLISAFNKALRETGINDFSWHGLRRTFATRLAQKGLDVYKISKLLGHENVRTAQKRYAHHCAERLRVGVEILDVDYVLTTNVDKRVFSDASKLL